jgi:hypothetical protein
MNFNMANRAFMMFFTIIRVDSSDLLHAIWKFSTLLIKIGLCLIPRAHPQLFWSDPLRFEVLKAHVAELESQ